MVGGFLKELVRALGKYARYRLSRVFGRRVPDPPVPVPKPAVGIASPDQIARLSDALGLDESYLRNVRWQSDRSDESQLGLAANPVYQLWTKIPEGHKWTQYFEAYEELFASRRADSLRILEIGVFKGSSLRLWRQYFHHPQTMVVGIDIDPNCAQYEAAAEGIHVRIGSQADPEFLKHIVSEFGPFDLIIDDGSHHSTHMIVSFNSLYRDGLKDGGIYFAEDLHANYWLPWRDSRRSFLDLCKELLELMHAHYTKGWLANWNHEAAAGVPIVMEVPEITLMIKEIRVLDSMVAIYKTRRPYLPRLKLRDLLTEAK
jgi:SAM-dependent methyltransferase